MYLLQSLIVFAVVGSNIHWQWTPNPYLTSGLGILLAWAVTWWIVEIRDRYDRFGFSKRFIFPSTSTKGHPQKRSLISQNRRARYVAPNCQNES